MGQKWFSEKWGFEITLSDDWSIQFLEQPEGSTVASIIDDSKLEIGIISLHKGEGSCAEFLSTAIESAKSKHETAVIRPPSSGLDSVTVYSTIENNRKWIKYHRAIDDNGVKLRVVFLVEEHEYEKFRPLFEEYAVTLKPFRPTLAQTAQPTPQAVQQTQPAPQPTQSAPKRRSLAQIFSDFFGLIVVLAIAAVVLLMLGGVLFFIWLGCLKAADMPYKAAWIITHWNQAHMGNDICSTSFCLETTTSKKPVGIWHVSCCNQHSPVTQTGKLLSSTLLHLAYWLIALLVLFIVFPVVTGAAVFLIILPIVLIMKLTKTLPKEKSFVGFPIAIGVILSVIAMLISWIMYMMW